jgi:hypothetical protein
MSVILNATRTKDSECQPPDFFNRTLERTREEIREDDEWLAAELESRESSPAAASSRAADDDDWIAEAARARNGEQEQH